MNQPFTYGSVCSGIEAVSVAWHPLGWRASFLSEIEPFPRAVLKHHYPDTPLHGDFTTIGKNNYDPIKLLVGGTPCQSFSIAGFRKGLDDERGNLALEYLKLAQRLGPAWLVWENVPGVLSSNGGRDFGAFLGGLVELGYGFAYRVLDAQYFGVAQRRRRVFVIGYLGDWRPAAAVLFERESLSGHPAPSREKREDIAGTLDAGIGRRRGSGMNPNQITATYGIDEECNEELIAKTLLAKSNDSHAADLDTYISTHRMRGFGDYEQDETASALKSRDYKDATDLIAFSCKDNGRDCQDNIPPTLRAMSGQRTNGGGQLAVAHPINTQVAMRHKTLGERTGFVVGANGDPSFTLQAGHSHAVAFAQNSRDELREMPITGALSAQPGIKQQSYIRENMQVRRLTPTECERLQGFPDGYTAIPWRNKPASQCPDSPRYKALGNSMAVPVIHWIGLRIELVNSILQKVA